MNRKFFLFMVVLATLLLPACDDGYHLDDEDPEWLGDNIYDYMVNQGNFTCYTRLIDRLGYKDVLQKTGSKTIFVADDEAFQRFFDDENNEFGAKKFEDLSEAQMKMILYSTMINNPQLIELLSNIEGPEEGRCLRRNTAYAVLDTIPFEKGENLPNTPYWQRFKDTGIRMAKDGTKTPMVHLLPKYMQYQKITDRDFCYLTNKDSLIKDGAYINGELVIKRDITCQNGYIHQLENLALPLKNMAEIIRTTPNTSIFSSFIERFSAPYYSESLTEDYNRIHGTNDSVFVKKYFSSNSEGVELLTDPNGTIVTGVLNYDLGWNGYGPSSIGGVSMESDMGAIFVPTDDAINQYFEAAGKFLIDRYGSKENIPEKMLCKLINNHLKPSFVNSVPSKFQSVMNDAQIEMGVKEEDINKVYFGSNGAVYVMNNIYPPVSYVAVSAPALVNENMQIMNWAIEKLQFNAYLLSMDSYFSFILPTDSALKCYVDPVSMGKTEQNCFEFIFNQKTQSVEASVYKYDKETGASGTPRPATEKEILDRLDDILDYHIIVGNIEDGADYYLTKGGGTVKINTVDGSIAIQGGGQIETGYLHKISTIYDQSKEGNGKTYVIDDYPLQPPLKSAYSILSTEPAFKAFYELLTPDDPTGYVEHYNYHIFETNLKNVGIDQNVQFFNTFHYTIYVPTNEAVENAIAKGLPTWDKILTELDLVARDSMAQVLSKFLRYHFQDNSTYLDKVPSEQIYETAAADPLTNRFYKLTVTKDETSMSIRDNSNRTEAVHVKTSNPALYNIMCRDYQFNGTDKRTVTEIETSSWAVIHQIDDVLLYDNILK